LVTSRERKLEKTIAGNKTLTTSPNWKRLPKKKKIG